MTGQTIKDYSFGQIIGKGGMATVYLASDKKFQTNVAVKVLNKEFVHNENIRQRFLAEARNMFRMSHPNVIKVTDLIDDGDLVAFVMDYIEGPTLKDYLDTKSSLSDQEIKQLFSQMLAAVGYVHEQGMVHRDIKPSNFIISKKGAVKLLDFGIAKNTELTAAEYTLTSTTQNMGTPMYMSPEQIKSSKDVQARSDIYSLGVVLWQMVTRRKPYDAQTLSTFDIQSKIVNEPLSFTGTGWDTIIKKATQKEISNRYREISSFQQAVAVMNDQSGKTQFLQPSDDRTVIDKQPDYSHPIITEPHLPKTNNKMKYYAGVVIILLAGALIYVLVNKNSNKKAIEKEQQISDSAKRTPGINSIPENRPQNTPYKITEDQYNSVRIVIKDFYDTENIENTDALLEFYKFPVERYFSYRFVDSKKLRSMMIDAFNTNLFQHRMDIDWERFIAMKNQSDGFQGIIFGTYGSAREGEEMKFKNIKLVHELNRDFKITAIYSGY